MDRFACGSPGASAVHPSVVQHGMCWPLNLNAIGAWPWPMISLTLSSRLEDRTFCLVSLRSRLAASHTRASCQHCQYQAPASFHDVLPIAVNRTGAVIVWMDRVGDAGMVNRHPIARCRETLAHHERPDRRADPERRGARQKLPSIDRFPRHALSSLCRFLLVRFYTKCQLTPLVLHPLYLLQV